MLNTQQCNYVKRIDLQNITSMSTKINISSCKQTQTHTYARIRTTNLILSWAYRIFGFQKHFKLIMFAYEVWHFKCSSVHTYWTKVVFFFEMPFISSFYSISYLLLLAATVRNNKITCNGFCRNLCAKYLKDEIKWEKKWENKINISSVSIWIEINERKEN